MSRLTPNTSDSFNRANENPLNPTNWSATLPIGGGPSDYAALQVVNDTCEGTVNSQISAELFTPSTPNDQYTQVTIATMSSDSSVLLLLRYANNNYYRLDLNGSDFSDFFIKAQISSVTAGVKTTLASIINTFTWNGLINVNDVWVFAAAGTGLYVFVNGVTVWDVTDSTYSSGITGLGLSNLSSVSATAVTNFVMGAASIPSLPNIPSGQDKGSLQILTLFTGTLSGWGGRTGVIGVDAAYLPIVALSGHSGESWPVRAHIDDFLFTPINGQRVQFYMVRNSAGDKVAKSIAAL